jgi:hypothetical protein
MHAGDYDAAIDYLTTMGGVARENDYEYLGQDDFCTPDFMSGSSAANKHGSSLTKVKVCAPRCLAHAACRQALSAVLYQPQRTGRCVHCMQRGATFHLPAGARSTAMLSKPGPSSGAQQGCGCCR